MVTAAMKLKDTYSLDGEGNGTPLQYSCLENPMGGGAWQAPVQKGCKESDMTKHAGKAEKSGGVLASS